MDSSSAVAVIGDLVRSRAAADRGASHLALLRALAEVERRHPAVVPFAPTVGDEFQALYADIASAVQATLLVRLELDAPLDARFGIGAGHHESFTEPASDLYDGSAWWSARDAIVTAKSRESGRTPGLRTWFAADLAIASASTPVSAQLINAYLLSRDQLVSAMDPRARRLLRGLAHGRTQVELAAAEGITQSAVSRSLHRNGAFAVLDGAALLDVMPSPTGGGSGA